MEIASLYMILLTVTATATLYNYFIIQFVVPCNDEVTCGDTDIQHAIAGVLAEGTCSC